MRKVLSKVDDARLGRAIAGLVTQALLVKDIQRRDKEVCALVISHGKRGVVEYGVCIRGRQVFCSCSDYRKRGVHCKHIAAVALYEFGVAALARSERKVPAEVELQQ